MEVRPGQAFVSAIDATSVMVTRASAGDVVLTCGGVEMAPKGTAPPPGEADPDQMNGTQLGKRYSNEAGTIELLCTTGGQGTLAVNGEALSVQAAKPLPASD